VVWGGCAGHPCERSAQHEASCQLVYILCGVLNTGDLQLAAGHLSSRLEYVDVLELMVRKTYNRIEERLTAMGLSETNVG